MFWRAYEMSSFSTSKSIVPWRRWLVCLLHDGRWLAPCTAVPIAHVQHMPARGASLGTERHVPLFKNGRNEALRIPRDLELPGCEQFCERKPVVWSSNLRRARRCER